MVEKDVMPPCAGGAFMFFEKPWSNLHADFSHWTLACMAEKVFVWKVRLTNSSHLVPILWSEITAIAVFYINNEVQDKFKSYWVVYNYARLLFLFPNESYERFNHRWSFLVSFYFNLFTNQLFFYLHECRSLIRLLKQCGLPKDWWSSSNQMHW